MSGPVHLLCKNISVPASKRSGSGALTASAKFTGNHHGYAKIQTKKKEAKTARIPPSEMSCLPAESCLYPSAMTWF